MIHSTCMPSASGKSRSKPLQQSLQGALMDFSLSNSAMTCNLGLVRQDTGLSMSQGGCTFPYQLGFMSTELSHASQCLALAGIARNPIMRPNVAAGLSSDELLLSVAAEQRMLEEARTTVIRQRALAEETIQRHHYNESISKIFGRGLGGSKEGGRHTIAIGKSTEDPPEEDKQGTLKILGSSLRKKNSPYLDVSRLSDPDPNNKSVRRTRGGVTEPFPEKLHRMLQEVVESGNSDIVSFFSHGRAFGIHDTNRFVSEVMPKYFKQSRLSSFQRQLNLYGFTRITSGPDAGGYFHELFLKGRPALSLHMRRVGVPQGEDRRKSRAKNVRSEPNFYAMGTVVTSPSD